MKLDKPKLFKKKPMLEVALIIFSEKGVEQTNMMAIDKASNVV